MKEMKISVRELISVKEMWWVFSNVLVMRPTAKKRITLLPTRGWGHVEISPSTSMMPSICVTKIKCILNQISLTKTYGTSSGQL